MFKSLAEKFTRVFDSFRGLHKISEKNISDAVREIRLVLLDADVSYGIVKTFISQVKEKSLGISTVKNVSPDKQFIKIVHEALEDLLHAKKNEICLTSPLTSIMLCGLQGVGKTSFSVKLAEYLRKSHKSKPLLIACDFQRPAAVEQLQTLGTANDFDVFVSSSLDPVVAVKEGLLKANRENYDAVIVDTAGRLHVNDELMEELLNIKKVLKPQEILFVANIALGQDAIRSAKMFDEELDLSGIVFTMMDSDAKAGAALSCKSLLGKPIKFESHGEHISDLYPFDATSMADRILGMGDTVNFVKKAQEHMNLEEKKILEEKIVSSSFSYSDYLNQIKMFRKMGSFKKLLNMIPGSFSASTQQLDETEENFSKIEAIILSMTPEERNERDDLSIGRMKRIAKGSGTLVSDVNKLKKSMKQAKDFFKTMKNKKIKDIKNFIGGV